MGSYAITRKLEFDAGHRVYGHESKCANIHGHRYVVEVTCQPDDDLDDLGRVIDFGVVKGICGDWIDENLDHGMILWRQDPLVAVWQKGEMNFGSDNKYYVMNSNPTAENIAAELYSVFNVLLANKNVSVSKIVVRETPNCSAEYPV